MNSRPLVNRWTPVTGRPLANRWRCGLVLLLSAALTVVLPSPADAAVAHGQIEGTGSSWAANAINTWIAGVEPQGLKVTFSETGSAQGRKDFANNTVDYAVTDIPYQGKDPKTGSNDTSQGRPYAYLPVAAGGTSLPYNIKVAGKQVTNLRLSGRTVALIFTNRITNWNAPEITADNNGHVLPSMPIRPVVHAEGSGSTAQFTAYLARQYPDIWGPFNGQSAQTATMTEYFPAKGQQVPRDKSDGVMNYIVSASGAGSIGYNEYSFALHANFPVVKLKNTAGYYTLPTDMNVAVSLTQAEIEYDRNSPNYLTQKLERVYTHNDVRTYPMSSYTYVVLPIGGDADAQETRLRNATNKRQTLVDFLYYSLCEGQRPMGPLGYSPLPLNLVQAGFEQVQKLKAADPAVQLEQRDVNNCNNPTFVAGHPDQNYLAQIAPKPADCDRFDQGPCGGAASGTAGGSSGVGGEKTTMQDGSSSNAGPKVDPDTGQVITDKAGAQADRDASGVVNELAGSRTSGLTGVLGPLAVLELLAVLMVPVLLNQRFARRRRGSQP